MWVPLRISSSYELSPSLWNFKFTSGGFLTNETWSPGEKLDDEHYKITLKGSLHSTFLLQTTSKSDRQAVKVQAILLTQCASCAFPTPSLFSLSYLLCASLHFCTHVYTDMILCSTFTQSLLDVCTPSPKWNAPYFFSSSRQDESLGTAQLAHSPRNGRLQPASGRENCHTCWFLEDGTTLFCKTAAEHDL